MVGAGADVGWRRIHDHHNRHDTCRFYALFPFIFLYFVIEVLSGPSQQQAAQAGTSKAEQQLRRAASPPPSQK